MAIECINVAELFIEKLFDWMLSQYQSMLKVSKEGADSTVLDWELCCQSFFVSSNYYWLKGS